LIIDLDLENIAYLLNPYKKEWVSLRALVTIFAYIYKNYVKFDKSYDYD